MSDHHTPGPWQVAPSARCEVYRVADMDDADASPISTCAVEAPGKPHPECEENARLIAAAPDLLEALRCVLGEADGQHADPSAVLFRIAEQARAVIAKAEGRS